MKLFILFLLLIFTIIDISAQGITKFSQSKTSSNNFVNKNGKIGNSPEISINGQALVLASLTTTAVSSITSTSAISGGIATSADNESITVRGVCWSTSTNPTIADSKTTDGTGIGAFTSSITGLTLGITYYVRAYATNKAGTAYGNELSFITVLAIGQSYQGGTWRPWL